jgi:rubrerythrin
MKEPTVQKSLELAAETERQGARFYTKMAKKFADKGDIAAAFEQLAADEVVHEKKFEALLEGAPEDPITSHQFDRDQYLRAVAISEFIKAEHFEDMDKLETVQAALNHAINLEKSTLVFYYGLKDELGGHDGLEAIIAEEKSHIVTLTKRLEEATQ